jgi:ABC-type antimicrobial peptide transport system permease subunit
VGELVSAVIIWHEAYADAAPVAAALFAIPFVVATVLLVSHRVVAGAVVAGLFSLFEAVQFPGWTRHNLLDAIYQSAYAALAIGVLIVSVAVIVARRRAALTHGHPGPTAP